MKVKCTEKCLKLRRERAYCVILLLILAFAILIWTISTKSKVGWWYGGKLSAIFGTVCTLFSAIFHLRHDDENVEKYKPTQDKFLEIKRIWFRIIQSDSQTGILYLVVGSFFQGLGTIIGS